MSLLQQACFQGKWERSPVFVLEYPTFYSKPTFIDMLTVGFLRFWYVDMINHNE